MSLPRTVWLLNNRMRVVSCPWIVLHFTAIYIWLFKAYFPCHSNWNGSTSWNDDGTSRFCKCLTNVKAKMLCFMSICSALPRFHTWQLNGKLYNLLPLSVLASHWIIRKLFTLILLWVACEACFLTPKCNYFKFKP